eukprot:gene8536-9237_t
MALIGFIRICAIFMMVVSTSSSLSTQVQLPKMESHVRGLFGAKDIKNLKNLRQKSEDALKESPVVKVYGYYESVFSLNNDCNTAFSKGVVALNSCSLSADPNHPSEYVIGSVSSYPNENCYAIYSQFFNDSSCTNLVSSNFFPVPLSKCNDNHVDNIIAIPLNPIKDNLDYSFFLYNSRNNCVNNNYKEGVVEAIYGQFGQCHAPDDPSEDVDTMVVSCASNEIVMHEFTSNNGSCTGLATKQIYTNSNFCNFGYASLLDNYYGFVTFGCAAPTKLK